MSQYPQFYDKHLDMYQVLTLPYKRSFDVFPGDKLVKKWVLDLESQAQTFIWESIKTRIKIGDISKGIPSQYWKKNQEKLRRKKKSYHQHAELGKRFLPL